MQKSGAQIPIIRCAKCDYQVRKSRLSGARREGLNADWYNSYGVLGGSKDFIKTYERLYKDFY